MQKAYLRPLNRISRAYQQNTLNARFRINDSLIRQHLRAINQSEKAFFEQLSVKSSLRQKIMNESYIPRTDVLQRIAESLGLETEKLLISHL